MIVPKTHEDLKRIVKEQLEETTQLEFKRELPPSGKNDDLARDLAAMANTEGGVIAYGIEQDDTGRAKALRPFRIAGLAERVALVAQTLDEALPLSGVHTVLADDSQQDGFLIVVVPASERAPHFVKGLALGRTPKGNVPLTRRQVGELFARSPGFAEEFGLATGRPGRVFVKTLAEPYQETDSRGRLTTKRRYRLIFENDGDADVFDAAWDWVKSDDEEAPVPSVFENPFPLEVMPPGLQVRIHPILSVLPRAISRSEPGGEIGRAKSANTSGPSRGKLGALATRMSRS